MKLYMYFEEKRTDNKQNEFYICRLFSIPCVSEQSVSVGDEFFYLYNERENTFEEIYLKVEKIGLRPNVFIDTVYYGHRGGFYFSGWGQEKIKYPFMSLTNFKL